MKKRIIVILLCLLVSGVTVSAAYVPTRKNSKDHFLIEYYAALPITGEELEFYDEYFHHLTEKSKKELLTPIGSAYPYSIGVGRHYGNHIAILCKAKLYTSVIWGNKNSFSRATKTVQHDLLEIMEEAQELVVIAKHRFKLFMKAEYKTSKYYDEIKVNRKAWKLKQNEAGLNNIQKEDK